MTDPEPILFDDAAVAATTVATFAAKQLKDAMLSERGYQQQVATRMLEMIGTIIGDIEVLHQLWITDLPANEAEDEDEAEVT